MRVTVKMALGMIVGTSILLFLHGWMRINYSRLMLERDAQQDALFYSDIIANIIIKDLSSNHYSSKSLQLIEYISRKTEGLQVSWLSKVDIERQIQNGDADLLTLFQGKDEPIVRIRRDPPQRDRVVVFRPIRSEGSVQGALKIADSLQDEKVIVGNIIERTIILGILVSIAIALLSMIMGGILIGRPISRIAHKLRLVGESDLLAPLVVSQKDEIGFIAREINNMSEKLARETQRREQALNQLRHSERLKTVGQLAAGVVHELRTPLAVISGRAELMEQEKLGVVLISENARIIHQQSIKMSHILQLLLDFSRQSAAKKVRGELSTTIKKCVEMVRSLAQKNMVQVEIELPPEKCEIEADFLQLDQVFTNLLINAIQAMNKGGRLHISMQRQKRRPQENNQALPARDYVCVSVHDSGSGIAPENLTNIFEPFFTTKKMGEGTGLGLAISHGIVKEHGGWIDVQSEVGRGSCFTVCLPENAEQTQTAKEDFSAGIDKAENFIC